ncbi:hypothetical protein CHS0354_031684 [Potamilus streckersoni]|uniref:Uncharacterized protein n=1 Tax=Potamilus streckersoni TaxID=2493646 RepID=A0AAE0SS90_9BIVA|nr:hypothetical protein CHS0354_031684 [Potamilus streckersoni]
MTILAVQSPRSPTPVPPYPGFDLEGSYRPESPPLRVKFEGQAYYNRNRGSIHEWLYGHKSTYESPRPIPRCPTSESKGNYKLGKDGTIRPLLDGTATPRPETAPPRIKQEGMGIATVSRGKRMDQLISEYGQSPPTPKIARVKPEAESTAEVSKGKRMNDLIHSYGRLPLSARAIPRVKPEAEEIADVNKGKRMNTLIHRYGNIPRSPKTVPRVKQEAEENAELGKGKRMNTLIHKYGIIPLSPKAVPRVKKEAEDNARLGQGFRMERLVHSVDSLPESPRMPPRVRYSEGSAILRKSRGTMDQIFRERGQKTCVPKPGIKQKYYLKPQMV